MKYFIFLIGIFISLDITAQWEVKYVDINGSTINEIEFHGEDFGFAMGHNGLILKSLDAGENWIEVDNEILGSISNFEFLTKDSIVLLSSDLIDGEFYERIYRSIDGGELWELLNTYNDKIEALIFVNHKIGYIAVSEKIRLTNNSGDDWSTVYNMSNKGYEWGSILDIEMLNDSIGYAVSIGRLDGNQLTYQSALLKTIDGGYSWNEILVSDKLIHSLDFIDDEIGFLSGYSISFRTMDGGQTLDTLNNLSSVVDIFAASKDTIYTVNHPEAYIGDEPTTVFAISKSMDSGESWNGSFIDGAHLETVYCKNGSTAYVAGDFSIIMKTNNCGGEIIGNYPWWLFTSTKEYKFNKLNFNPNPVANNIHLDSFEENYNWGYTIVDLNGTIYKSGYISNSIIDVSHLSSGIYFLRLKSDEEMKVGKFIKQ